MITQPYSLCLLTPCFNGGAQPQLQAELRVPSIRGQIRWWFNASLAGNLSPLTEQDCFGGIKDNAKRSAVTFRLPEIPQAQNKEPMLPHKGMRGGERPALPPQNFSLLCRCQDDAFPSVDRAVKLWVLLGGLGARSNRAAGSMWFSEKAPESDVQLQLLLRELSRPLDWDIQIAEVPSAERGRGIASDTVNGIDHLLGGIRPRKNSPIKLKVITLSGKTFLLMFAPRKGMWEQAVEALSHPLGGGSAKPLTELDWQSVPAL